MAWRRGTQNKQAGEIRRGQVKEFLVPSSHETADVDEKVWLTVVATEDVKEGLPQFSNNGYVRLGSLPGKMADIAKREGAIFLHAHEHPSAVVRAVCVDAASCEGKIALNEAQRLNSRVCLDQKLELTLYRGRHVALDGREAAIGNTAVEIRDDPRLETVVFEVRPQFGERSLDGKALAAALARHTFDCLVTVSEVFVVLMDGDTVVARVGELRRVEEGVEDDDDEYRGMVTASTKVYVVVDPGRPHLELRNAERVPPASDRGDRVNVTCSDEECFPVRRALLRPCMALTRVSQAGKGKYDTVDSCAVPMDCCTFDRVLLYLEHDERHGGPSGFKFDPTLAAELLQAAEALGIAGLSQACQKVLGSFKDRVRNTPIRLQEVVRRNAKGSETAPRGETFLVLDYMVLDITRWLPEHPGGDRIIPEQALNCDCTVMFEVYHVSRQSFLYLKEFYVGELALEDRPSLPLPAASDTGGDVKASDAFIEELRRHTPWRLDPKDLVEPTHKSF